MINKQKALNEAKGKKSMKEEDDTVVDVKGNDKESDKEDSEKDEVKEGCGKKAVKEGKKSMKEEDDMPADKEDEKKDGEESGDKEKMTEKKKCLTQSYREEEQPAVETKDGNLAIKESVALMFDGETLSEDFKKKAEVIFEAALKLRIDEEIEKIEAVAQKALAEEIEAVETKLSEQTNDYLQYVVGEWLEENKVQVEKSLKTEIYESFFDGLKALFVEHNINVPAEKVDMLEAKEAEVAKLVEQVNKVSENLIEANKKIFEFEQKAVIAKLAEGLTDTQFEKLNALTKDIEAKDVAVFEEKATIIRENFFKKETAEKKVLTESQTVIEKKEISPAMKKYLAFSKEPNSF